MSSHSAQLFKLNLHVMLFRRPIMWSWNTLRPCRDRTRGNHPENTFALCPAVSCALRFCRPAATRELRHSLSPNKTQFPPLRSTVYKYPRSRPFERLVAKIVSHPTVCVGSNPFVVPRYMLVFALKTPRADRSFWL